jgi:hypothetical protein
MFAIPTAIPAMPFADRFTSRNVQGRALARIVALDGLLRQRFASHGDRAQTMFAPRLWYAAFAVAAPALEDRLAAHGAGGYSEALLWSALAILALRTVAAAQRDGVSRAKVIY